MRRISCMIASALLATGASAQDAPAPLPPKYVRVSAPTAQRLVLQAKAATPEITKIGLHATPDGVDNAIIASDVLGKIGKRSSPTDMQHLAGGEFVTRIDGEGIYDLLLPIADRAGRSIGHGFVVMEVPVGRVADASAALAIGRRVRDRLQRAIPSKAALYGP